MSENLVTANNFDFVAKLLREQCGFVLEPGKEYLVKSRLWPLAQKHALTSVDQLIDRLRLTSRSELVEDVVEAMLNTETSFFRDLHPFEMLKSNVLPALIERRRPERRLNIWCAASASGQEPYSIALLLREHFPAVLNWQIYLLATDISQGMLARSSSGRYSRLEVNRGLPEPLLEKWFHPKGADWYIDERVRSAVTFSRLNLARAWPAMPEWDLILLRNVMIYFDNDTKRAILDRIARVLAKDGYLLLGGAETTLNLSESFSRVEMLRSGFYQLRGVNDV